MPSPDGVCVNVERGWVGSFTFDVVGKSGASILQNLQRFVIISNALSTAGYSQGPLSFVGTHLSSSLVEHDGLLGNVHFRVIGS